MNRVYCLTSLGLLAMSSCAPTESGPVLNVTAKLTSSTCGAAVDAEDTGEFQVEITKSDEALEWFARGSGNPIHGSVNQDDEFTLGEVATIQVTDPSGLDPGCAVRRHDSYAGTLTLVEDAIAAFEAELVSEYTEAAGYSCDALIGAEGGFSDLPCKLVYDLAGEAEE